MIILFYISDTPTTCSGSKFTGSPGLRRKLLVSELRSRDDSSPPTAMTKPRLYSPPLHRPLRATMSNSKVIENHLPKNTKSPVELNNNKNRKRGDDDKSIQEEISDEKRIASAHGASTLKISPKPSPKSSPVVSKRLLAGSAFYTPSSVGQITSLEKGMKDSKNGVHDLKLDKRLDVTSKGSELKAIDREPTYV